MRDSFFAAAPAEQTGGRLGRRAGKASKAMKAMKTKKSGRMDGDKDEDGGEWARDTERKRKRTRKRVMDRGAAERHFSAREDHAPRRMGITAGDHALIAKGKSGDDTDSDEDDYSSEDEGGFESLGEKVERRSKGFANGAVQAGKGSSVSSNAPAEMSSRRPVGRLRSVPGLGGNSVKRRDPRFDSLCGMYNEGIFESSYSFITDYRVSELGAIKKKLRKMKGKDSEERRRLLQEASVLKQKVQAARVSAKRKDLQRKRKQKEKEAVAAGKKPFFAKRAARREEHARATFEAMKEGGNLKRYMKKRQKKLSHQDRRRMRG